MEKYGTHISILLLVGLIGFTVYTSIQNQYEVEEQNGSQATAFAIPTLGTGALVGPQDHLGDVVLVEFWATYCDACDEMMPSLQTLHDRFTEDDFELLSVNVDHAYEGVFENVNQYRVSRRLTFPVLYDARGEASEAYDVRVIPYLVLIDREGKVRYVYTGQVPVTTLIEQVENLLAETSAASS